MNRSLRILAALVLAAVVGRADPSASVDVFTGTSNSRWMMFPGATVPFGMVKLSPDNQANVWNGGYEYTVGSISGFSHLHAFSLSGLSLMPVTGPIEYNPGLYRVFPGSPDGPFGTMWTSGYRSRIRKDTETGSPGYYRANLIDYGITAEVTATARCGMLRFTYPATPEAHLLCDFAFPTEEQTKVEAVHVELTGPSELSGWVRQTNNYSHETTLHFVVQLDTPIASMDAWTRGDFPGGSTNYGTDWRTPTRFTRGVRTFDSSGRCGIVLNFATKPGQVVKARTALSFVSLEGARRNLAVELGPYGWSFDAVRAAARRSWNDLLGRVEVEGGTADQRRMFYTCLYRAYSAKSVLNDADGSYYDANHVLRHLAPPADAIYSSDALWGCQWTLFPLWTLVTPKVASSWVHFLLAAAANGGWIPEAPVNGGYSDVMGAQHQDSLIVSAYQKGIRDFDAQAAYRAIRHDLTTPGVATASGGFAGDKQLAPYMKYGYIPDELGTTSNTFEYAYDDWTLAEFARALGREADYRRFRARSMNYRNAIDPATRYARPRRADGTWVAPFDPHRFGTEGGWSGRGFMEGTPWIYTWFVPQDPAGLISILGKDRFNRRLQEGFEKGYVDLGNEPNLQAPFLFNYSGKPWLTQKYVHESLLRLYNPSPLSGWIGEEDEGQLSALYVMWSMGLFELDGGCYVKPYYDLTSPLFDRVIIHLDRHYYGGRTFVIEAHRSAPGDIYIQSARLDGKPLNRAWITHAEIVRGGTLEFDLGPRPNRAWATGPGSEQPLMRQ